MAHEAVGVDDLERPVSHHLVGDMDVVGGSSVLSCRNLGHRAHSGPHLLRVLGNIRNYRGSGREDRPVMPADNGRHPPRITCHRSDAHEGAGPPLPVKVPLSRSRLGSARSSTRREAPMGKEYVGIDLHRRRSVIYRMDEAGEKIDCVRIDNDPVWFAQEVEHGPQGQPRRRSRPPTAGTGRSICSKSMGYVVHLSNPHGNDWGHRRVKNDERDARDLADLLRLGRLAEAWIAPPETRELRELVRFRLQAVQPSHRGQGPGPRSHGQERDPPVSKGHVGRSGNAQFDALELPDAFDHRLAVLRSLVQTYDEEIERLDRTIHSMCRTTPATTPSRPSTVSGR